MKVVNKYSHLNGEEYLIVHKKDLYDEILKTISLVDANKLKTKISKEKRKKGNYLYNQERAFPRSLLRKIVRLEDE